MMANCSTNDQGQSIGENNEERKDEIALKKGKPESPTGKPLGPHTILNVWKIFSGEKDVALK